MTTSLAHQVLALPGTSEALEPWSPAEFGALVGRSDEQAVIDELLASVRRGFSASLVVRGEPGIGKTALLRYAADRAGDLLVANVLGVESEMELGFAGLHQLVRPFLPLLPRLPRPQRQALSVALGLVEGAAPDRFLVGLGVLTLLSETAGERGLLCVVDDAQWLDQVSSEVLAFVARRCEADRVGFLFAVREPHDRTIGLDGLDHLVVPCLDPTSSRRLLATLAPAGIAAGVAHQLVQRAAGNPLALVELTRELDPEQLAGTAWLPDPLPLAADMQTRFVGKIAALPAESRMLLLLAAVEPSGDLALFERAAELLGVGGAGAGCRDCGDLLEVDEHVRFRHPLIRSAAYQGATADGRRRAHAAIAAASDPVTDPDRVAWHRAAAASEPDEEVAAALERSADRANGRGGAAASAAFLRRAAELTPDPLRRTTRLLAAAGAEFRGGSATRTLSLVDRADPELGEPAHRAAALHLRGAVQLSLGEAREASTTLLQAAETVMPVSAEAAREILLEALAAAFYAGRDTRGEALRAVRRLGGGRSGGTAVADLLLDGFVALLTDGRAAGAPLLEAGIQRLLGRDVAEADELRWLGLGMWAANELFDRDSFRRMALRWVALCREKGELTTLPLALDFLGTWQVLSGQLDAAESANTEGREILAATGNPDMLGIRAVEVLAPVWRGLEETARQTGAALVGHADERDMQGAASLAHYGLAVLELSLCNYSAALEHALLLMEDNGPAFGALILPEAVEAAARCQDETTAQIALERLAEHADAAGNDLVCGLLARSRALVSRSEDNDALFGMAIERLGRCVEVFELARAHLLYGEWLRRGRRRAEARKHLRTAHETFLRSGAERFAARAWAELAASGEKARRRTVETTADLTARELQIAELVTAGAKNAEVAAQLFISPSTVEYHLRHVFQKLDVNSRTKLAAVWRRRSGEE